MTFREEDLEFLRNQVFLTPKDFLIIQKEKRNNPKKALELEYELRWDKWKKLYNSVWEQYGNGLDLDSFCYKELQDAILNEKRNSERSR